MAVIEMLAGTATPVVTVTWAAIAMLEGTATRDGIAIAAVTEIAETDPAIAINFICT